MTSQRDLPALLGRCHRAAAPPTLLAVCPNSAAVLEAGVRAATQSHAPLLFAATRNQVDIDGGYTGWTPASFSATLAELSRRYGCHAQLYPCLDHGGPWLKQQERDLPLEAAMTQAKASIRAALLQNYALLHLDATPSQAQAVPCTLELLHFAEQFRQQQGLPPVLYEVGGEKLAWTPALLARFLAELRAGMAAQGLNPQQLAFVALPAPPPDEAARQLPPLQAVAEQAGIAIKLHRGDWLQDPAAINTLGIGGLNVGPELAAVEAAALLSLERAEQRLQTAQPSAIGATMRRLLASPENTPPDPAQYSQLRYLWQQPPLLDARQRLYANSPHPDPHGFVVAQIAAAIQPYLAAFGLVGLAAA